jgi:hypothetical protein
MGFFNKNVFKPIRGGGAATSFGDSNYESQPSGGMDFKNFMASN